LRRIFENDVVLIIDTIISIYQFNAI